MKVGIIQSSYIPWRGYFDFIAHVDLFVFHDDVQFTHGDWRNRNKIKDTAGSWLSIPVLNARSTKEMVCEKKIDYSQNWLVKHKNKIRAAYARAPYFSAYFPSFCALLDQRPKYLSVLNINLIHWAMECLGITTPTCLSTQIQAKGQKTDKLIDMLTKLRATRYLSGPSASAYLDLELFARAGIGLEYKTYDYEPYPQLHGAFNGFVSILDLLFNLGEEASLHLASTSENIVVL